MKTIDKYVIRTFLSTAAMLFGAMMALRIVVDLMFNLDEFTERAQSSAEAFGTAWIYYADHALLYFVELGGVIIVAAAAFSLFRLRKSNELTAMLACGISLHRIAWPIIVTSMLLSGLIIIDQELLIPRVAARLVRDRDDVGGRGKLGYPIALMVDSSQTAWYSPELKHDTQDIQEAYACFRNKKLMPLARAHGTRGHYGRFAGQKGWKFSQGNLIKFPRQGETPWTVNPDTQEIRSSLSAAALLGRSKQGIKGNTALTGFSDISDSQYGIKLAAKRFEPAPYHEGKTRTGTLDKPVFSFFTTDNSKKPLATISAKSATWRSENGDGYWQLNEGMLFIASNLTPEDMIVRQAGEWMAFTSTRKLLQLMRMGNLPNSTGVATTLHLRITNPVNNLVMLLLAIPFILSRQRNIKTSIGLCLLTVAGFYAMVHGCRYVGLPPVWSAWLPILIFGPIAAARLDAVKT